MFIIRVVAYYLSPNSTRRPSTGLGHAQVVCSTDLRQCYFLLLEVLAFALVHSLSLDIFFYFLYKAFQKGLVPVEMLASQVNRK